MLLERAWWFWTIEDQSWKGKLHGSRNTNQSIRRQKDRHLFRWSYPLYYTRRQSPLWKGNQKWPSLQTNQRKTLYSILASPVETQNCWLFLLNFQKSHWKHAGLRAKRKNFNGTDLKPCLDERTDIKRWINSWLIYGKKEEVAECSLAEEEETQPVKEA